jgi:3D (Asp-Asp-Asp) domain-containing protein/peptidoglycan hydrolase CwlO-like protein
VLVVPAVGSSERGPAQTAQLRAQTARIGAARHSTTLALYALDSRLATVDAGLADLERRAAAIRELRAAAVEQLAVARTSLTVAEQRLGEHLRALYEQGNVTPLDVFLGADSLDEALGALDNIDRAASADRTMIDSLRTAREGLTALNRRLAAQEATIDALRAQAAAAADSLARAQAERRSYLDRLAHREALTRSQIAAVEARAAAAQARTEAVARTVPEPADPILPTPSGARTITVDAVAYSLPGRTYIGLPVGPGVVAVDPSVIALGTKMTIPGYGEGIAADIGSAVKGSIIDLWFPTLAQAKAWGRRTVTITLHG